ncbi:MAG TPA: cytidine deaminase [Halanaerobiales bacterium]|nr:cytidine deaminase [Halanaerobiales bacterium]
MIDKKTKNKLLKAAKEVKENAYVPYSNFPLAAALLTKEGKIFTGVNIENAAYGVTMCAERTAIFKAVSEGYTEFEALLLLSNTEKPITPCGSCRQVISEFSNDIDIIMTTYDNGELIKKNKELLPGSFNKDDMK